MGKMSIAEVQKRKTAIFQHLEKSKNEIAAVAASHIKPATVIRFFLMAATTNSKLLLCTRESIMASLMQASGLGLDSSGLTGEAFLIPYGDVCTFQAGYKGHAKLARNSAQIKDLYAVPVKKNDDFEWTEGLERNITHKPASGPRGETIGCYGVVRYVNGGYEFAYMTREEIIAHRDRYSQAWQNAKQWGKTRDSPWLTEEDEMFKKTLLNKVLKLAPKSLEVVRLEAIEAGMPDPETASTAALLAGIPDEIPEDDEPEKEFVELDGATVHSFKQASEEAAQTADPKKDPDPADKDTLVKKELVQALQKDLKNHGMWETRRDVLAELKVSVNFTKSTSTNTVEELDAAIQTLRERIMAEEANEDVEVKEDDWGDLG